MSSTVMYKGTSRQLQVTAKNAAGDTLPTPVGVEIEVSTPGIVTIDEGLVMTAGNVVASCDVSAVYGAIESDYINVSVIDDPSVVTSLILTVV